MKNLTPELIAKARAAKSAEELLLLAEENGIELSPNDAKTFFEQLHMNAAVSDDDLEAVSGGGICQFFENLFGSNNELEPSACPYRNDGPDDSGSPLFDNNITSMPQRGPSDTNNVKFV